MMRKQVRLFLLAVSFYSRIPVPASVHSRAAHQLPDSIRYLPLIGWITGLVAAFVFFITAFIFGNTIAVVFSMVASVLLTGAFHEDGFADVCDGFGGGWTKEKILSIMKDSRLGTYGVTGLILLLGMKFAALQQLLALGLQPLDKLTVTGLFVLAHTLSRFAAITLTFNLQYARLEDSKASGAVAKGRSVNLILAALFTLVPLLALILYTSMPVLALSIVPVLILSFYLGAYFKRWIGGYTGDCLGAVQQLSEVVIYLAYIVLWKFT